ncbi:transglycosylase SLT domain-containing protein [Nocardia sp. NPDC051570]|uniref:transglycosylase SLT domain-containing protein n=1 Tax=Nocardia sp. NPDC051570 TaxID=3364324 RepID=UPI0037A0925D
MATSYSAGVAKIVIRPDLTGFKEKLETEIRAAIAGAGRSIPVSLELDAASVAEARKEARAGGPVTFDAKVTLRDRTVSAAQAKAQGHAGTIRYRGEVRNDRDSAARAGREAARDFGNAYRQEQRRTSHDANRRVGSNEAAANRQTDRYSPQRPLSDVEQKAAADYREASRRLDGYNRRFAAADRAVATTEARVAALMRDRADDLNALWRRETTRITREIDTLRGAGSEDRGVGRSLTRSTRSRRIADLQRQLREDPTIGEGRASSVALEQRLREARRQLDARRDVRRTVAGRGGPLNDDHDVARRTYTDLVNAGDLSAQMVRARDRITARLNTSRAALAAIVARSSAPSDLYSDTDRPALRAEAQARRLLRGRLPEDLPLAGDRNAISNATAAAARLESAERTLWRTREGLRNATAAVSTAEKAHEDLRASGETDVVKVTRARERVTRARTVERFAHNDYSDADVLKAHAAQRFERAQSSLVRRIEMPRLHRASDWIDATAVKAAEALSEKLLFAGRMLSSVTTIAASAGAALAAIGAVNLVPVIASLTRMGAALAVVPALAGAAAAAVGTIAVGVVGLKDALKAESELRHQATSQAQAQADKVADAQRRVRDSDRAVSDAVRDAAITRSDGADRIVAAEKRVQDSQRTAAQAQKDLSSARRDAVDKINDYNRALKGIPLSEHQAQTRLLRAQATLANLWKNKDATWLDYREAMDAVEAARQDWDNTIAANQRLQRDALEANAKGVEGDDAVVRSKQQVVDAIGTVREAERDRGKTVRDVAVATANAENAVTKALEAQQDALREQQKAFQSDAQQNYLDALNKLSPNARAFVEQLHSMDGTLTDLRKHVQDNLFEGLAGDMARLGGTILPLVRSGLGGIATGINEGVRSSVRSLATEVGQLNLKTFLDESARAATRLGDSFAPATRSLLTLASTGGAFLPQLAGAVADWATTFDNRVAALRASGELATAIERGLAKAGQVGTILKDSLGVVTDIFKAITSSGDDMLTRFETRLTRLRAKLQSAVGQENIRDFFGDVSAEWTKWSTFIGNAVSLLKSTLYPAVQGTYGVLFSFATTLLQALTTLDKYTPVVKGLVTSLLALKVIGSLSSMFERWGTSMQNFAQGRGLEGSRSAVGAIGTAMSRWSGYIAGATLAVGLFSSKVGELSEKLTSIEHVQAKWSNYGIEFRQGITDSLLNSGGIVDDSVRGKIGSQFQSFLGDFQTLKDAQVGSWRDQVSASLKDAFTTGSHSETWDKLANGMNQNAWGSEALNAWKQLNVPIKAVQDAVAGTNEQFNAFKQYTRDVAGENSGYFIPVLDSLRGQLIKAQDAASKTAEVYDKIRDRAVGAADAVEALRNSFKRQQADALALENSESAAYAGLDTLRDLLKGNGSTGKLNLSNLVDSSDGSLDTHIEAARTLSKLLQDLAVDYKGVAAAEYTSVYNQTRDADQAQQAQRKKITELRDSLVNMLKDTLPQDQIDGVLSRYGLMLDQLADAPAIKPKVDTSNLDVAIEKTKQILTQLDPNSGFAPIFKAALTDQERQKAGRDGNQNPYGVTLSDQDRRYISQLSTDLAPPDKTSPAYYDTTSAAYYKALAKDKGIDEVLKARADVLDKMSQFGGNFNAMTLAQLQGTNVALGLGADDLRYLDLDNIHNQPAPQQLPSNAAPPSSQSSGQQGTQPGPQPQGGQPPSGQPGTQQPPAQSAGNPPKPADLPKPTAAPQVPDFAPASATFTTFADDVQKGWKDKLDPALSDMATKAATVGQAVVDAKNVATPAFDDLVKLFTDRISGERGLLPEWGKLKTTIDADVTTITGDYWAKRLVDALTMLGTNFGSGVAGVSAQWAGMKKAIAEPLDYIFGQVFGVALKNAWAQLRVILPNLPEWKAEFPRFGYASGGIHGVMSGYSPGVDDRVIAVGGGEAIMRPEWTRAVGADYVDGANAAARRGGIGGVRSYLDGAYATGGIVATDDPISAVQRSLWDAVRTAFPGATLTSATRTYQTEGHADYHNAGKAIDLGGPMDQIARWIYTRYPQSTELIHWPLNGWKNLKNGAALDYGSATNEGHRDHVHWANGGPILSDGRMISTATGGLGDVVADVQDQITALLVTPMQQALSGTPDFGTSALGGALPTDLGKTVSDAAVAAVQQLASAAGFGNVSGTAGVEQWRPLVEKILREKGQPLSEANRVLIQMSSESSGNPRAINLSDINARNGIPSKGLMQVIDPTFRTYADRGYDQDIWDPESNIRASLNYALARYGSLAAAYQGRGYDSGGWLPDGGFGWNKSGEPEPVFTGDQWRNIQSLIGSISDLVGIIAPQNVAALPVSIADASAKFLEKLKALLSAVFGKPNRDTASHGAAGATAPGTATPVTGDGTEDTDGVGSGIDHSVITPGDTIGQAAPVPGTEQSLLPTENPNVGEDLLRDALSDLLSPEQLDAMFPSTAPKVPVPQADWTPAAATPAAPAPQTTPTPDATPAATPDASTVMPELPTPTPPDPASLGLAAPQEPQPETVRTGVVRAMPSVSTTGAATASANAAKYASLTPNAVGKKLVHMGLGFVDGNVRQFLSDVGLPGGGALGNALDQAMAYKKSKDQQSYAEKQAAAAGAVHYHVADIDEAMRKETIRRWQQTLGFK